MSHVRTLGFDALEGRRLLSAARAIAPHTMPMIAAAPVVLDGTLTVDNQGATSSNNADGSSTSSTPVAGHLAALGKVRGVWNESQDAFGDSTGVDVLRLHNSKGSIIITFNTLNTVKAEPAAHGALYYSRAQKLYSGTGAYAGATESGMINLTTNHGRNQIVSLTIESTST